MRRYWARGFAGRLGPLAGSATAGARSSDAAPHLKENLERFAGKLERASPNLFTFMACEGVEPTNNEAERQIRESVIHRKVRGQLTGVAGMERFATLMTRYGTQSKRGVTPTEGIMGAAAQARG